MNDGSGIAWFLFAWICAWPVIAVTFFVLWLRKGKPRRRLGWVDAEEDDDDQ